MSKHPECSIIIPTLDRPETLEKCLESLRNQTFQDFEIILIKEEGPLAKLRNDGAKRAHGKYLIFIDDDTITSPEWLESIHKVFQRRDDIGGVSGPSFIRDEYRRNRDLFKFHPIKRLYDEFFLEGRGHLSGYFTKAGAWTTGACNESCDYDGEVQYLEACNMAFRSDLFNRVGGFDESYKGVGDWSEPDLAFRISRLGYKLWFSRDARLEHRPSKSGAYKKRRKDSPNRMANYELFSKRWIAPHWKHTAYKLFLRTYYWLKENRCLGVL